MSTTEPFTIPVPDTSDLASVTMRFEVVTIPVTDVDRAKAFYQRLGWRLDIDLQVNEDVRAIQFTPPGSAASIHLAGRDVVDEPLQRLYLIVDDVVGAREELVERGVEVSEVFHAGLGEEPAPGRDPDGRSYASFASVTDPDGNQWLLQEITERFPGRV